MNTSTAESPSAATHNDTHSDGDRPRKRGLRSCKPQVPLPRNGKKCSLERHYSGALRQLVGILDHLAGQDPERFVWATEPYLVTQCRDYRREKRDTKQRIASKLWKQNGGKEACYRSSLRYGLRIVQYCKAALRSQHVIGEREQRERLGILRWGFVVKSHDELTRIVGKHCLMCAAGEAPSAASSAAPSAVSSAGKVCGNVCGIECGTNAEQTSTNQQNAATVAGSVSGFDGGSSDNHLAFKLSEPTAVCASQTTGEQEKDSSSTGQDGVTAVQRSAVISETQPDTEEECQNCKGKGYTFKGNIVDLCLPCLGRGKKVHHHAAQEPEPMAASAVA